jgi:glycosyltransferase involved in cell wall biosynthesis
LTPEDTDYGRLGKFGHDFTGRTKLKLNWFSPLPPAKTDIARYTCELLPDVCSVADVTVWASQGRWDSCLPDRVGVQRYRADRIPWLEINRADVSIYHIGNNPASHAEIWEVARQKPGIVVLHDTCLHHFFDGIYRRKLHDLERYVEVMRRYYGPEGAHAARRNFVSKGRENDGLAVRYPLTEHALEGALAVLVHTAQAHEHLRNVLPVPVSYAPLPFRVDHSFNAARSLAQVTPPFRLVVFGHLGSNRRVDAILTALAGMSERDHLSLDIYGILGRESEIKRQLKSTKLRNVKIHGFVSDQELNCALSSAHIALNLRYPTMGEASGTQLRIWSHALPSLVSEVGWYASLPRDTVRMVRPGEYEISDIQRHLRDFLEDPGEFKGMGERGCARLLAEHSPQAYANALVELVCRVGRGPRH